MFEFAPNLYFADVCCDSSKNIHHVKLVMTSPGSWADRFCSQKLRLLNTSGPECNPFFFFKDGQAYVTTKVVVSFLCTVGIDLGWCLEMQQETDAFLDWRPEYYGVLGVQGRRYNWNKGCAECNIE